MSARQSQTSPLWYVDHERCEGAVSEVQHFGAGTGVHHGCAVRMRQLCKEKSTIIGEQPVSTGDIRGSLIKFAIVAENLVMGKDS